MIYFIQDSRTLEIKIGFTASSPAVRMKQLQTGSSSPLVLIASVAGDMDDEKALHRRFAEFRREGEWFVPVPAVLAHIVRVVATEALSEGVRQSKQAGASPEAALCMWRLEGSYVSRDGGSMFTIYAATSSPESLPIVRDVCDSHFGPVEAVIVYEVKPVDASELPLSGRYYDQSKRDVFRMADFAARG